MIEMIRKFLIELEESNLLNEGILAWLENTGEDSIKGVTITEMINEPRMPDGAQLN